MHILRRGAMRTAVGVAALLLFATQALAALKVGQPAPDFAAKATLGGKKFVFSLSQALKLGPIVVYFYPAAFTHGCTIEAHEFAAAIPDFKAAGARVIGVSGDDIATLDKFSVSECQSKFAVASDRDHKIMNSYDAKVPLLSLAMRTSYVIGQDGRVRFAYTDMDPDQHVIRTLAALRGLSK
jgi:thioredoxin-dependent peroxiredoxin